MSRQNVDVNGSSNAAGCRRLAKPTTFTANLTQANEVPPTGSPATGSATVVLDPAANTLSVHVTFSGLTSNTVAAHIHCCLDSLFEAGVNVGVATTVPAFPGFPLGVTSGTYDHVLDLTSASSYNPAFVTMEGGSVAGRGGTGQWDSERRNLSKHPHHEFPRRGDSRLSGRVCDSRATLFAQDDPDQRDRREPRHKDVLF